MKLFLESVYHPVDDIEHERINDTLNSLINYIPKTGEFIRGHDVNANLGVMLKIHRREIGPHGIDNMNKKGRRLLGLLIADNIKIMNTFYQKDSYTTWRLFDKTRLFRMLAVIASSFSFFKCIIDCGATPDGVQSDHSEVKMVFLNRTIKFNSGDLERPVIDWNKIKKY